MITYTVNLEEHTPEATETGKEKWTKDFTDYQTAFGAFHEHLVKSLASDNPFLFKAELQDTLNGVTKTIMWF